MNRFPVFLALVLALPGMSKTPEPDPMPMACEVLETAGAVDSFGPGATLDPKVMHDDDSARLSLCTVNAGADAPGFSLLLRDVPGDAEIGAEQARATYVAGLQDEMGLDPAGAEEVALGEAAVWIDMAGQLTVWMRGGSVMMIFYVRPSSARALADEVAAKVVAAYP